MNLVGAEGQRRERLARLVPGVDPAPVRRPRRRARRRRRAPARYRASRELRSPGRSRSAWDGDWYRRAYFDDGTPLGSKENAECRIDAIAQSWAVISGAGDPERARQAMASVDEQLVRETDGLVLLLTPPFDQMEPSPGYIQGYCPACARTAASTRTPRSGPCWPSRGWATAIARPSCSRCSTRSTTDARRRKSRATAPSRTSSPPTSTRVPPHTGRGGWTWYTGSAGWMYRVGIEAILGITLGAARCTSIRASRGAGPVRGAAADAARRAADRRREPGGVCRGVAVDRARWRRVRRDRR